MAPLTQARKGLGWFVLADEDPTPAPFRPSASKTLVILGCKVVRAGVHDGISRKEIAGLRLAMARPMSGLEPPVTPPLGNDVRWALENQELQAHPRGQ